LPMLPFGPKGIVFSRHAAKHSSRSPHIRRPAQSGKMARSA